MDYRGTQPRAVAAIFGIDMLDHFFAAFMFEIDINVGRLATRSSLTKRSNQDVMFVGIHGGDPEAKADGGIGGRPTSLT